MKTVEQYLMNLIRIPSTSFLSNSAIIHFAKEALCEAGWTCVADSYSDANGTDKVNLIAAPIGQEAAEPEVELAFLCHTDTVPPAADWSKALEPFEKDGMLYGCGSCDVKGFLACLLTAASGTAGTAVRAGLRIVLTADEEIGCLGSHRLLSAGRLRPRTLVIGEPTSLRAARAGKGYCLGEIIVQGAEAHSAHPKQGRSAIYAAARIIQAIERLAEELENEANPFFDPPYTTLNIGTIGGGTAKNVVPAECRFLVEWRPVPGATSEAVPDRIAKILRELNQADPSPTAHFTVFRQQQSFQTSADSTLVREMERLTGRNAISIPFGSEASVFASLAEEIVVFGPGDMRTAHSPRECVPIFELREAVRCLASLMIGN